MSLKIVTDSACDVPPVAAEALGVTIVPVYINIGEEGFREGVDITRDEFYRNLSSYRVYPTTAAPSIGTFTQVYEELAAAGATEILSIHLADSISATCNAARLGAEAAEGVSVTVYDSRQITLGAGLLVVTAAAAAAEGKSLAEIVALLDERVTRSRVFGMLDNLEALRRSGRVNWAQFGLGTLLRIKPVMMIQADDISVVAKIRTRTRALEQTIQMVSEFSPFERLAIIHVQAAEAAEELRQQAENLFQTEHPPFIMEVTPAIGVHLGIGAVGFACIAAHD
ncbi:MAG: DegV family protein [Chloroflexota bacterium]|jgi:DegV family protein with EDD domain